MRVGEKRRFSVYSHPSACMRLSIGACSISSLKYTDVYKRQGVFASYLVELEKKHGSRVSAYTFRDKRLGWKNFSAVATFENGEEHAGTQTTEPYLYGFLQNLYLRPSCHSCSQLRGERHAADITLADLWLSLIHILLGEKLPGEITPRVQAVADFLNAHGVTAKPVGDMVRRQWGKLMLNVGLNQTVMVFEGDYGTVQQSGKPRDIMIAAMREVQKLATLEGYPISDEEFDDWVKLADSLSPCLLYTSRCV